MSTANCLARDVGIRIFRGPDDTSGFIKTYLCSGLALPCSTGWYKRWTAAQTDQLDFTLYEAVVPDPDPGKPEFDYRVLLSVRTFFESAVPHGTAVEMRLLVNGDGVLTMEGRRSGAAKPLFGVSVPLTLE